MKKNLCLFGLVLLPCFGRHWERRHYNGVSYVIPVYTQKAMPVIPSVDVTDVKPPTPSFWQRVLALLCCEKERIDGDIECPVSIKSRRRSENTGYPNPYEW